MPIMRCNDRCHGYSRNTLVAIELYVRGYMRCSVCACMISPQDIRKSSAGFNTCPCCHTRLIAKPRSPGGRARFRQKQKNGAA